MRIILLILVSVTFLSPKAQNLLPVSNMNFTRWQPFPGYNTPGDSNHLNQKWYFSTYSGLSAGFVFYNGGSVNYLSAPVGVQLNHPLNNNLIAFAGISVAPTFFSFSHSFMDPAFNKSYPGSALSNPYAFGINPSLQMGLMYVNDAKTFSISGSIGVERSSYPIYPVYPSNRTSTKKQ
ncbi:MAG TPA: hypothetical protein VII44_00540 [Puia sp.]